IFQQCSRRIQNGGWARQVTQADFQIAEEISPVPIELSGFSGLSGDHPLPYPCQSRKAAHALSRIVVGLGASGEPLTLSLPHVHMPCSISDERRRWRTTCPFQTLAPTYKCEPRKFCGF